MTQLSLGPSRDPLLSSYLPQAGGWPPAPQAASCWANPRGGREEVGEPQGCRGPGLGQEDKAGGSQRQRSWGHRTPWQGTGEAQRGASLLAQGGLRSILCAGWTIAGWCSGSAGDWKGAFLAGNVLSTVDRGAGATLEELVLRLLHSSSEETLALFWWLLHRHFRGQALPGRCHEQRGAKLCTGGRFGKFHGCLQGEFPGPAESHEISAITQRFKGECLITAHRNKTDDFFPPNYLHF